MKSQNGKECSQKQSPHLLTFSNAKCDIDFDRVEKYITVISKKLFGFENHDNIRQEAWLSVLKKIDKFDSTKSNLYTYIYHVIYGSLLNYRKKCHRQFSEEAKYSRPCNHYNHTFIDIVDENKERLSQLEEQVIRGVFIDGKNYDEIAKDMKMTRSSMHSIGRSALNKLKSSYEKN